MGCALKKNDSRSLCNSEETNTPKHGVWFLTKKRDGGFSEGETPGPIPNPEVKPFSADGTAPETVWESRTPPSTNTKWGLLLNFRSRPHFLSCGPAGAQTPGRETRCDAPPCRQKSWVSLPLFFLHPGFSVAQAGRTLPTAVSQ
jgi:hypothetical protein